MIVDKNEKNFSLSPGERACFWANKKIRRESYTGGEDGGCPRRRVERNGRGSHFLVIESKDKIVEGIRKRGTNIKFLDSN